jgi:hypothetical protein
MTPGGYAVLMRCQQTRSYLGGWRVWAAGRCGRWRGGCGGDSARDGFVPAETFTNPLVRARIHRLRAIVRRRRTAPALKR